MILSKNIELLTLKSADIDIVIIIFSRGSGLKFLCVIITEYGIITKIGILYEKNSRGFTHGDVTELGKKEGQIPDA